MHSSWSGARGRQSHACRPAGLDDEVVRPRGRTSRRSRPAGGRAPGPRRPARLCRGLAAIRDDLHRRQHRRAARTRRPGRGEAPEGGAAGPRRPAAGRAGDGSAPDPRPLPPACVRPAPPRRRADARDELRRRRRPGGVPGSDGAPRRARRPGRRLLAAGTGLVERRPRGPRRRRRRVRRLPALLGRARAARRVRAGERRAPGRLGLAPLRHARPGGLRPSGRSSCATRISSPIRPRRPRASAAASISIRVCWPRRSSRRTRTRSGAGGRT